MAAVPRPPWETSTWTIPAWEVGTWGVTFIISPEFICFVRDRVTQPMFDGVSLLSASFVSISLQMSSLIDDTSSSPELLQPRSSSPSLLDEDVPIC